jgi:hypothetical protein
MDQIPWAGCSACGEGTDLVDFHASTSVEPSGFGRRLGRIIVSGKEMARGMDGGTKGVYVKQRTIADRNLARPSVFHANDSSQVVHGFGKNSNAWL